MPSIESSELFGGDLAKSFQGHLANFISNVIEARSWSEADFRELAKGFTGEFEDYFKIVLKGFANRGFAVDSPEYSIAAGNDKPFKQSERMKMVNASVLPLREWLKESASSLTNKDYDYLKMHLNVADITKVSSFLKALANARKK